MDILTISRAQMCPVLINGRPLTEYGGAALLDYTVGEPQITAATFQGVNRSTVHRLRQFYGVRPLTLNIVFTGDSLHAAKMQRSILNGVLFAGAEIFIPDDGFVYSSILESEGAEELIGQSNTEAKIKASYSFRAMRRLALVTETIPGGGVIVCRSTVPTTDCRLTVTVGASASSYQLGGATFGAVSAGDVLVFDGIECIITRNGANAAATTSWVDFPQLVRGENTISARDPVTVEYYPTFL